MHTSTPDLITKNLAFNVVSGKRKARLSTNFLQVMGYTPGDRLSVVEAGPGLKGFKVVHDPDGKYQVYSRGYKRARSNNPLESVIEFGSQKLIGETFPSYTERFHVEMRKEAIKFTPMANRVHAIHSKLKKTSPFNAFVGLTGGVDIHCMESMGWKAEIVLEHRPIEARDISQRRNLTEVHALNTLVNGSPKVLLNEDIYNIELDRLSKILSDAPPISLCHFSLGCDDHSPTKSPKAKQQSFDDLSTMYDMVYPMLKQVEIIDPAVVAVENVKSFRGSGAGKIMTTTLRRLGYNVSEMTLNSTDYGATQNRERYYMVGSIYPNYIPPEPTGKVSSVLKTEILEHLSECNDVTDRKFIKARETKSRNMPPFVTIDSLFTPTFLKSQDRGISDGVYIEHEGRIYKPSQRLMQRLMSIPESFNVSWMAKEQAIETLGQSIDYRLHHALMQSITRHIEENLGSRSLLKYGLQSQLF
ncbi:DNA cytosine methyltransferase [Microbulbifer epialgicus]|uniref:DNA (cytosine-5-)-methyltransferase n=1 Tax=Microbulbifer epialgicus TaxID=393907 RepID=A0ABV4NTD3_9GAMM